MNQAPRRDDFFQDLLIWFCLVVTIFCILGLLSGCQTTPVSVAPVPELTQSYALDLKVQVNSTSLIGWGVAPISSSYKITVTPNNQIDRIQWRTCNQDHYVDRPPTSAWTDIFGGSTAYSFVLTPDQQLDQLHHCPLEIDVMAQKVNKFQSAIIDFNDARPEYVVGAIITCNGSKYTGKGALMCSSAAGLIQQIVFDRPVLWGDPEPGCSVPNDVDGKKLTYQIEITAGDCLYTAGGHDLSSNGQHESLRLFTHGYNTIPLEQ